MSRECSELHELFNGLPRHRFPFNESEIPLNGLYVLFERGEKAHKGDWIVRIGTHTGVDQLRSRLGQHFVNENKDRSIFRKNIGRALLNKERNSFLKYWELDLTTRKVRDEYSYRVDFGLQAEIEKKVTEYIQENLSFAVLEVKDKVERLGLESKLISTVSLCSECGPSPKWFGHYSTKEKVRESGLWLVNELYKEPITKEELDSLKRDCF